MHIPPKMGESRNEWYQCNSRAFQWMIMSLSFDNLNICWAISVSCPWWWQTSPSVTLDGDRSHHQSLNS
jgi:hypothetical protein